MTHRFINADSVIAGVGGFVIGVGAYVLTDMIDINGKIAREWLKEGVRSLW